VLRGEPLLERKLAPVGTLGRLSAVIAEGKRAMTVRVNDVVGVAGFALPGNYVDVMVNAQQDKEKGKAEEGKQISKTVLERVLVLAVAQEASRDDTKPKVVSAVTLELSPAGFRKAGPGAQRRHPVAGAAQPGRPEDGATAGVTKERAVRRQEAPRRSSQRRPNRGRRACQACGRRRAAPAWK
jgi:pilus assembly protein CpaB